MKKQLIVFLLSIFEVFYAVDSVPKVEFDPVSHKTAAKNVLRRLLGSEKADLFHINIVTPVLPKDGFHILKIENLTQVEVIAPNAVSALWGVHYYLKKYCNCHFSWDGNQIDLPEELPAVTLSMFSAQTYRYYQNPRAYSYTYVWWTWSEWEKEIDWMAMNGINMALALTAQEAIWTRVYAKLKIPPDDFTGPAYLAWYRMGNLKNHGGGLYNYWHSESVTLQHKILARMRELGITPVIPGFCGIVPESIKKAYPQVKVTKMASLPLFTSEHSSPHFLEPSDPFFNVIAQDFYKEYKREFGSSNMYSCDMFSGNIPPIAQPEYLTSISQGIFASMNAADPRSVWIIQSTMFKETFWLNMKLVEGFLRGIPFGKLIILDIEADTSPQYVRLLNYFGHPFIWCTQNNVGGQMGLYGSLNRINLGISQARLAAATTMIGIGLTPEGRDQNYVVYEFTLDCALSLAPIHIPDWISKYARRRYGTYDPDLDEAWHILKDTSYNYNPLSIYRETPADGVVKSALFPGEYMSKNILTSFPSIHLSEVTWFNKTKMFLVFQKFLSASQNPELSTSDLFKHDFIDVTRQTIQFAIGSLYLNLTNAFMNFDTERFQSKSYLFLKLLPELDTILKSGKKYLLGTWLKHAINWASSDKEVAQASFNARSQITLWGPHGERRDRAAKQWSGLIQDFYKKRWSLYIKALKQTISEGSELNPLSLESDIYLKVELPFVNKLKTYPIKPVGNPIKVIMDFNNNWGATIYEIYKDNERSYFGPDIDFDDVE